MNWRSLAPSILIVGLVVSHVNSHASDRATIDNRGFGVLTNLKNWSMRQAAPFVLSLYHTGSLDSSCIHGWDLLTNIQFVDRYPFEKYVDSLHLDSIYATMWYRSIDLSRLDGILDSSAMELSEGAMFSFLESIHLYPRMMRYDSLTYQLNLRLLSWASHQDPPVTLGSGCLVFVHEGPNAGGYSQPWFRQSGVQNLQCFTRGIDRPVLIGVLSAVNDSLSRQELQKVMSPIAELRYRNTWLGSGE